jgi:hypothetical protein
MNMPPPSRNDEGYTHRYCPDENHSCFQGDDMNCPALATRLHDDEFTALLNVLMEADPWAFTGNRDVIEKMLDAESRARGYGDWIEAIHHV